MSANVVLDTDERGVNLPNIAMWRGPLPAGCGIEP